MFTIYVKKVDGIPYDRYYKSFENAKKADGRRSETHCGKRWQGDTEN